MSDGKDVNDIVYSMFLRSVCLRLYVGEPVSATGASGPVFFSFSKLVSCIGMATSMFLLVVVAHAPLVAQRIGIPTLR